MIKALAFAAVAALAAVSPAAAQSSTGAASASATATASPKPTGTSTGSVPTQTGTVNGFLPWPYQPAPFLFEQTTDCTQWYAFIPKGEQLQATVCFLDSYAFSWVEDKSEATRGDVIPANVTTQTLKCLPPNADKLFDKTIEGRVYIPKTPGDSQTKKRCYTEVFPKGKSCFNYDVTIYMSISLKWTNDTNDGIPLTDKYFQVPQTLNISNSRNIECGSWSTAPVPTGTSTVTAATVTVSTSRPGAASSAYGNFFALVQAVVLGMVAFFAL